MNLHAEAVVKSEDPMVDILAPEGPSRVTLPLMKTIQANAKTIWQTPASIPPTAKGVERKYFILSKGFDYLFTHPQPCSLVVSADYDLCITCYNTKNHDHKMEKLGLGLDDESNNQQTATTQSPGDSRRLSIQRCIQSLVHACQCRNANCSLPSCQKMKRVVQHTKGCKRKTNGGCPICKQLIALCCYHAKHCQENKCPVPFCLNIKHKLRQQQLLPRCSKGG
ncbi:lymphocyte antigen 6 complex locus protein G6c-like [Platysternon megacephalum]|uniref:histone acetyltransferase n=1 Tax=Platysternon megacephalum TaxID=55544 RepID=A0A4D9EM78_9SAUR|nr:lymphocyte antigen 6 complex locus protein G6c-like [Platysternon megacephalum]